MWGDKLKMGIITKIKQIFSINYYSWRIRRKAGRCGEDLYCGGKSWVTTKTYIGNHVSFNGMGISGNGSVEIGDYFHSGVGCQIITSFHNYEGNKIPYDETFIDVSIGKCVWLGNNVIVLGGVTIGEGAIIQAGSVVCKDIPAMSIARGHPAVTFKYRDKEHYYKLKDEGAFY